jgi:hypothetical protein
MDLQSAIRFSEYYPNFQDCLVQVFDDVETRKDKTLAREALRWNDETQKLIVQSNEK